MTAFLVLSPQIGQGHHSQILRRSEGIAIWLTTNFKHLWDRPGKVAALVPPLQRLAKLGYNYVRQSGNQLFEWGCCFSSPPPATGSFVCPY